MNDRNILLVDDNPDDVALTLRALERNNIGNPVDVALDGEEALNYLLPADGAGKVPALILLDINLPKVTGLEVLKAIRGNERTRLLPVVVLTTSNEERDIVESYARGANSFVRKPVVFREFQEAVRVLGLYWLLINQSAAPQRGA
ncbi:MAG TPA: response regulator [Pilimelia sp.]|nr:response regulator [Pilimelia sp.]